TSLQVGACAAGSRVAAAQAVIRPTPAPPPRSVLLRAAAQARAFAARHELDRDLARRLVDHLVAEHHRALALALGRGLLVRLEDVARVIELLLADAEDLVQDRDLVGVQRPLAVVA